MLDSLVAIAKIDHPGEASDDLAFSILYGSLPEGISIEQLKVSCGEQPSIRKFSERLVVTVPHEKLGWRIWLFDRVPPVTELPQLAQKVTELSRSFLASDARKAAPVKSDMNAVGLAVARLADTQKRGAKTVYQHIANAAVEASLADVVIIGRFRNERLHALAMTDQSMAPFVDEIATVVASVAKTDESHHHVAVSDLTEEGLNEALLAEMAKAEGMTINLKSDDDIVFVTFGPKQAALEADIAALREVAKLVIRKRPKPSLSKEIKRAAGGLAGIALVVWLALPGPWRVTATALGEPQSARVLSLPVGAFLDEMNVQVGDVVQQGDVIAQLRAPDLEEQRLTYRLEKKVEEVAAQTALSENDYGA